jgi:hypothetical protein
LRPFSWRRSGSLNASERSFTVAGTTQRIPVVGVFESRDQAEQAVDQLRRVGFGADQIGVVVRDGSPLEGIVVKGDLAPEKGASTGAVAGGLVGGLLGAGIALTMPGIGPVLAAGVLAGILGGATIGIASGGLVGGLIGLGLSREEASYFDREFQSGRTLVTVRAGDRYAEAANILSRCGAYERHGLLAVSGR